VNKKKEHARGRENKKRGEAGREKKKGKALYISVQDHKSEGKALTNPEHYQTQNITGRR
jgi:hypothetical protein